MSNPLASLLDEFVATGLDATILLANGVEVTGLIESAYDGLVSIRRRLPIDSGAYPDLLRHYRTDQVVGAWFTDGS